MAEIKWDDEAKPGPQIQWDDAPAPDTRNALTRGYESFREAIPRYVDPVLDWTPGPRKAAGLPSPGEQVRDVFPKSITGGLAQTAVGLPLGKVPVLNMLPAPLQRILAATGLGEVGGQLEDRPTGRGAIEGAIPTIVGEGAGAVLGPVVGALPGGKGLANRADARRIGAAVEGVSPPLRGARTTEGIRDLTEGGGQKALSQAKEQATQRIEGMLPGQPGTFLPPRSIPASQGTQSFRAANDELSDIGARAFSRNPLDRTFQGVDQRQAYGALRRDIESGLGAAGGPQAAGAFNAAQADYAAGSKILDFLRRSGVVDAEGFLNVARMQRLMNNPKNVAVLQRSLGPEGFARLEDAIFRGAGRGAVDRMASGGGGMLDALNQVLRGTNTGASQMWRIPIATAFPNIGSRYVGQHPLAVPDQARPLFDLLGLKITDEVMR